MMVSCCGIILWYHTVPEVSHCSRIRYHTVVSYGGIIRWYHTVGIIHLETPVIPWGLLHENRSNGSRRSNRSWRCTKKLTEVAGVAGVQRRSSRSEGVTPKPANFCSFLAKFYIFI